MLWTTDRKAGWICVDSPNRVLLQVSPWGLEGMLVTLIAVTKYFPRSHIFGSQFGKIESFTVG